MIRSILCVISSAFICGAAPISISGTANSSSGVFGSSAAANGYAFSGPGLTVSNQDFFIGPQFIFCTLGATCNLSVDVYGASLPDLLLALFPSGVLNGISANSFGGKLTFVGSAPASSFPSQMPQVSSYSVNIPVTVSGTLTGFSCTPATVNCTNQVWALQIAGSGTAVTFGAIDFTGLNLGVGNFLLSETFAFTGTATVIPEPGTFDLLLAGLGGSWLMRRFRKTSGAR